MASEYAFSDEEMAVDERVGYPKAYAKLCGDKHSGFYSRGPPFTFAPYSLQQHEILRAKELDLMFPVIKPKAKATAKPKIFLSLLWKQLSHLGNAGFDPSVIRVDPYGNVLYYHADPASPLAWDIDHWFPCPRGGLTVPSNLRLLQWQVCKKKHNKLEFLIPWWEFQLGISVNQFLSIFASSNSDFRHRAFSFLFSEGENEELNDSQTVESHSFPKHFAESKEQAGLAAAAIVASRREYQDSSSTLRSLDYNRQPRPQSPLVAATKVKPNVLKENENPDLLTNPYQAIVMARDSLKQREESSKMKAEMDKLDNEVHEMRRKNEEEKHAIQDLETALIKRRRRAEKCRRLAEAQSSYRTMLEKMIRDAMHQSVIYKEQVRLNQAASTALMARLEAQKAICDAAERELHQKYRQRDELEKQLRPEWAHARKRSRMDGSLFEDRDENGTALYLPGIKPKTPLHKELRAFLEEEQRASEAALARSEEQKQEETKQEEDIRKSALAMEDGSMASHMFPVFETSEIEEEDEESRRNRGKGNVEKWLQMLLQDNLEETDPPNDCETRPKEELTRELNSKLLEEDKISRSAAGETGEEENPGKETVPEKENSQEEEEIVEIGEAKIQKAGTDEVGSVKSSGGRKNRKNQNGKEESMMRSESARILRRIPSSPSIILGMKKGVDCIRKKPMVTGDDENSEGEEDHATATNSFIKSSIKTIKKAVKI